MQLLQRLVVPLYGDLLGLCLIGGLHHHLDEFGLIQLCVDQNFLALLDVNAAADDEIRILSQCSFIHKKRSFFQNIMVY